jgi:hypothetical protein
MISLMSGASMYEKDNFFVKMPDGTYRVNNCEYKWEKRELFFHDGHGLCFVKKGHILGKAACWMCDCEQFMKHLNCVHAYALQYPEHIRLMAKGTKDKQGRNTRKKGRSRYEDTQDTATSKKVASNKSVTSGDGK